MSKFLGRMMPLNFDIDLHEHVETTILFALFVPYIIYFFLANQPIIPLTYAKTQT